MNKYEFAWDENKHKANIRKHGISFQEASSVFDDPNILYLFDEEHSDDEDRFVVLGISSQTKLLAVFHCYRENDTVIRIISARKANKFEHDDYYGGELR